MSRIAEGDAEAFAALYDAYKPILSGFLFNLTKSRTVSEDLLQDTFMRIWEDRGSLVDIRDFKAYVFTMVKHRALNVLKRICREELAKRKLLHTEDWAVVSTEADVQYQELRRNLDKAVRELPPQQQSVYRMSREQGLRQEEISFRLNVTVSTVKKHLTLSLRHIRKSLYFFF